MPEPARRTAGRRRPPRGACLDAGDRPATVGGRLVAGIRPVCATAPLPTGVACSVTRAVSVAACACQRPAPTLAAPRRPRGASREPLSRARPSARREPPRCWGPASTRLREQLAPRLSTTTHDGPACLTRRVIPGRPAAGELSPRAARAARRRARGTGGDRGRGEGSDSGMTARRTATTDHARPPQGATEVSEAVALRREETRP